MIPRRPWLLFGALAFTLGACREPAPSGSGAPTETATPADGPLAPLTPSDRSDPGPRLERPVGERPALDRPPVSLEVDAVETVDGAVYLRALVPPDPRQVVMGAPDRVRIEVLGERRGVAVPAAEGRLPDRAWLYVRLVGAEPPPDPLQVRWHQGAMLDGEPGQIQTLNLVGAAQARPFTRLSTRMHEAMSRGLSGRRGQPPTAFHAFAAGRMAAWGVPPTARGRSAGPLDALSLRTAPMMPLMMRDRGLRLPRAASDPVKLVDIEAPRALGWSWTGPAPESPPAPDPLAAWAPAEWIYLRLAGVEAGLALYDEATGLFGPTVAALSNAPGERRLFERLLETLALDRAALEALGKGTGEAAILLTDPLLDEGPGLVAVLTVEDEAAVKAALDASSGKARAWGHGVERVTLSGRSVERIERPTGVALRALDDGMLLLANSPAALDRVFAARAGTGALKDDPGFARLRSGLPGAEAPVLLAVAGAAHLTHLTSPRFRLLAGRRIRALVDLRAVDFAGLLFGWLRGQPYDPSTDHDALVASGLLSPADLTHDDGSPITLDGGRPCSKWGCSGAGRPLIDAPLEAVDEVEAEAYARLRSEAFDRWHEQVAPMAMRVDAVADGYTVRAQMLPLPKRHRWRQIARQLGQGRAPAMDPTAPLEVRLAVAADAPLKRQLADWLSTITARRDVTLDWLGEHLVVGVAERSGIWDGVLNIMELPNTTGRRIWRESGQRKRVLDRLPLYALAPVIDRAALDRALTGARVHAQTPQSPIGWTVLGAYRGVEVIELRERLSEESDRVGIFLGVAGETLVVGVERPVFEAAVDRVLDGGAPGAGETERFAQATLRLAPSAGGWIERALLGAVERFAIRRINPAREAFAAVARGTALLEAGPARDAALLRWLGLVPSGPHGDRPTLDAKGAVLLPRYGTATVPRWPALPVKGDPLTTLRALEARVGFDDTSGRTALRLELSWRRR